MLNNPVLGGGEGGVGGEVNQTLVIFARIFSHYFHT